MAGSTGSPVGSGSSDAGSRVGIGASDGVSVSPRPGEEGADSGVVDMPPRYPPGGHPAPGPLVDGGSTWLGSSRAVTGADRWTTTGERPRGRAARLGSPNVDEESP
jgi:hypothetical protein